MVGDVQQDDYLVQLTNNIYTFTEGYGVTLEDMTEHVLAVFNGYDVVTEVGIYLDDKEDDFMEYMLATGQMDKGNYNVQMSVEYNCPNNHLHTETFPVIIEIVEQQSPLEVTVIEDVKENEKKYPSKIKWRSSITDEYKKYNSHSNLQAVNLFCGKEMDMDSIPESLKQYL